MSEAAAVALLSVTAVLFLGAFTRMNWLAMAAMAPIIGVGTYTIVGTVLVVTAGRMVPTLTLGVTAATLGAIGIGRRRRPDRRTLAAVVLGILGVAATAGLTLATAPTRLTPDSLQYIAMADLVTESGGIDAIPGPMLAKRGLTTSVMQTLGTLDGRPYSAVAGAVVVIAAFAALAVLIRRALAGQARSRVTVVATAATVFAITSNRGLYDAFYVNSHGMVMAAFFVVVTGGFLAPKRGGWRLVVAISAAVMVPARPEGILLAAVGLLPVLTHPAPARLERVLVAAPTSVTALVWFGFGLWSRAPGDRSLSDTVVTGLLIGIGLSVVAVVAGMRPVTRWAPAVPWITLGSLVLLLGVEFIRTPDLLLEAVGATAQNLLAVGGWGVTWLVLGALVVAAMLSDGFEDDGLFIAPLASYAVLFWLFGYLRDGAYRVGAGDSGNRILAHALLAAIAYVAIAAGRTDPAGADPLSGRRGRREAAP